jgi:hypothetical protein
VVGARKSGSNVSKPVANLRRDYRQLIPKRTVSALVMFQQPTITSLKKERNCPVFQELVKRSFVRNLLLNAIVHYQFAGKVSQPTRPGPDL